jgi:DNA-binding IclR family transcriptional regulator
MSPIQRTSAPPNLLGKIMLVLRAFNADDGVLTFTELRERTGLAKGTLHRVLADLVAEQMLDRQDRSYRLGSGLFELGMRASGERCLLEVATPFLEDLYERTHEIAHLGLREGAEVVYIAKFGGHRQANSPSRLGGRMPLHATAIGKVLLAYAPDEVRRGILSGPLRRLAPRTVIPPGQLNQQLMTVKETGLAYDREESALGVACVAAPIYDDAGSVIAAVSVTGSADRFRPRIHAGYVRGAAAGISAELSRREQLRRRQA